MLTSIDFRNYRAFAKGGFRIKPLTIIVGANSVGKTSLLHLLLLLKQTYAVTDNGYISALKLHGRDVSIGDPRNFFFNRNVDDNFTISISFQSHTLSNLLKTNLVKQFKDYIIMTTQTIYLGIQKSNGPKQLNEAVVQLIIGGRDRAFTDSDYKLLSDYVNESYRYLVSIPTKERHLRFRPSRHMQLYNAQKKSILELLDMFSPNSAPPNDIERVGAFLQNLSSDISGNDFVFEATMALSDEKNSGSFLRVREIALRQGTQSGERSASSGKDILRIGFNETSVTKITSSYCDERSLTRIYQSVFSFLRPKSPVFGIINTSPPSSENRSAFPSVFYSIMRSVQDECGALFSASKLAHIGPLRAYPKRFYFLDIAHSGTSEGDLLVETLRENELLREKVNTWLSRFGMGVSVKLIEQLIYRLSISNTGVNFDLDITDVGFGLSQLLPILVEGFASPDGKTIMVEQPEIHLHPKMQGELADLFIDIAGASTNRSENPTPRRNLIIETHSEYLLSRLRRRIAEGTIRHSDVALYVVSKNADSPGSTIKGSYIPAGGDFEWPEDFFADDLEDTLAFLQSAVEKDENRNN